MTQPRIGILMGSMSDKQAMQAAADILDQFDVPFEWQISSAHRTPRDTEQYASSARERGLQAIICGAGMAAHLAGVVASFTTLPVLAVPMGGSMMGWDALFASVQMPGGIPVATFTVGRVGAKNAALMAISILARSDDRLDQALLDYRRQMTAKVRGDNAALQAELAEQ